MKKYIWTLVLVGCIGVSFAQNTNISWTKTENFVQPGQNKVVTQDLGSDNMTDLQSIQSRFCNDDVVTKDLNISLRPGQRKDVCIVFSNPSSEPKNITFWFSEGALKDWAPICQADMTTGNKFAKYILNNTATGITLPVSGSVIQKFTFVAPKSASWTIFGCFGYQMGQQEKIKEGNMFLIVPRKVWYIYVNITGNVYNFGRRDGMKNSYSTNKSTILKVIIAILAIWLVVTIVKTDKKSERKQSKKIEKK